MQCHGVAVLPENMSQERFNWLDRWVSDPSDIVRTPGSESNVKEIYDTCKELDEDPHNVIFNQFCEFGNHLVHLLCTGSALERTFEKLEAEHRGLKLRAFVSATGSAGTIAAGDYLKERHGTKIVAMEALECPTLLYNGFGEHNIQGIGDKHLPLIHNATNTDLVVAVSDRATDSLGLLFNTEVGQRYLNERRGVSKENLAALKFLGLSGIANVVAAVKVARYYDLGPDDAVITVGTDGAAMYASEYEKANQRLFSGAFDAVHAAEVFGQHLRGIATDHLLELSYRDRNRIFNLGYFTWVEQQGVSLEDFEARRRQEFWRNLRSLLPVWDEMITAFNEETGAMRALGG
jgi:cysteine synthase